MRPRFWIGLRNAIVPAILLWIAIIVGLIYGIRWLMR